MPTKLCYPPESGPSGLCLKCPALKARTPPKGSATVRLRAEPSKKRTRAEEEEEEEEEEEVKGTGLERASWLPSRYEFISQNRSVDCILAELKQEEIAQWIITSLNSASLP